MDTNFEKQKNSLVEKLTKKAPDFQCPVCKQKAFELGGGYFAHDLQEDFKSRRIGGINVPTVPVICSNCGFVAEFAAGTLGLLSNTDEGK